MPAHTRVRVCHVIANSERAGFFEAFPTWHSRERFDISLLTLTPRAGLHEVWAKAGLQARALHWRSRRDTAGTFIDLLRFLIRTRFDVVHLHLLEAVVLGIPAARIARVPLAVLTAHHHNDSALHYRLRGKRLAFKIDRAATRLAHGVIAPSAYSAAILLQEFGLKDEHVAVIPYGFPPSNASAEVADGEAVRREFGLEGATVFGAIGRLHWIKNYPVLLRAFAALVRDHSTARLVIIGEGPERAAIAEQVRAMALGGKVVLTGFRPDVPRLLKAIDVFVHASLTESFNQALVESLLAERPVVTTRVGIAPDLLLHENTGYLALPGSAEDLLRGMRWALANRERWEEIGRAGARAAHGFTNEQMVAQYEMQYLDWLGVTRAAARRCGS